MSLEQRIGMLILMKLTHESHIWLVNENQIWSNSINYDKALIQLNLKMGNFNKPLFLVRISVPSSFSSKDQDHLEAGFHKKILQPKNISFLDGKFLGLQLTIRVPSKCTSGSTLLQGCHFEARHCEEGWSVLFLAAHDPFLHQAPIYCGLIDRGQSKTCGRRPRTWIVIVVDMPCNRYANCPTGEQS